MAHVEGKPGQHTISIDASTNTDTDLDTTDEGYILTPQKSGRSASTDLSDTPNDSTKPKVDWRDLSAAVQRNIVCNSDGRLQKVMPSAVCDACPHCSDTCQLDECEACSLKRMGITADQCYTICQTRRNRNLACCWIVVDAIIYDATDILELHPGGVTSIVRHSGGVNCAEHLYFHSARGKKKWKDCYIGRLVHCKGGEDDPFSPPPPGIAQNCSIS